MDREIPPEELRTRWFNVRWEYVFSYNAQGRRIADLVRVILQHEFVGKERYWPACNHFILTVKGKAIIDNVVIRNRILTKDPSSAFSEGVF